MSILTHILRPLIHHWARAALPDESGRLTVPGLTARVRIVTDGGGVPHILAENEGDLFFAQGWLHARERLWQMEVTRRFATGELAELLGDQPLTSPDVTVHLAGGRVSDFDLFSRAFGIARAARASRANLDERSHAAADAYAAGVNRSIEEAIEGRRLPPEMRLLRAEPRRWDGFDVMLLSKVLAFSLSHCWRVKLTSALLAQRLGPDSARARELIGTAEWPERPRIVPDAERARPTATTPSTSSMRGGGRGRSVADLLAMDRGLRRTGGSWGQHLGSNSWVVDGRRSSSGGPLLANDPHLQLTAPGLAYLVHLRGGDYDVMGASFPGAPGIVLGRNRRIAWGCTNVMADDVDWFVERTRDGTHYLDEGEVWREIEVLEETIQIKGRPPRVERIRMTSRGPIMTDVIGRSSGDAAAATDRGADGDGATADGVSPPLRDDGFGIGLAADEVLSMSWTAERSPGAEGRAILELGRASSWEEFTGALRFFRAPAQNFIYADVDGKVGYHTAGWFPRRRGGGARPTPTRAWTGEGAWEGDGVPFEELPSVLEPASGAVITANNKIHDEDYAHYITDYWDPPYRARRIGERLDDRRVHTVESFGAIQREVTSVQARALVTDVIAPLAAEIRRDHPGDLRALDAIVGGPTCEDPWDFLCDVGSRGAAAFHAFLVGLSETVIRPQLGASLHRALSETFNGYLLQLEAMLRGDGAWIPRRSRARVVAGALKRAAAILEERLPDGDWRWGRLHRVTFNHAFHGNPMLAPLFDVGPFEAPGSSYTPWNGQFYFTEPFDQVSGPAYRHVSDLAETPPCMHALGSTGRSGNPVSPRYRSDAPLWFAGGFRTIHFDEDQFDRGAPVLDLGPG